MEIFRVFGSMFLKGADETDKQLDDIDSKAKKTGNTFTKFGKTVLSGATIAGGAVLGLGTAISGMAEKGAAAADRVDKLSQRIGLSREGFQTWDFVLSQAGVSIDSMQMGMKTLSGNMNDAINGAGKGADLFKELGLEITDSMSQEEAFNKTITALQNMDDGIRKASLAQDLFGRNGQELLPLINSTAESTEELKQKAKDLGLIMSNDTVDAGVKLTDTMDQLKRTLSAGLLPVLGGIMPMVQSIGQLIIDNAPAIMSVIGPLFSMIMPLFTSLVNSLLPMLINGFGIFTTEVLPVLIKILTQMVQITLPVLQKQFEVFTSSILPVLNSLFQTFVTQILPELINLWMTISTDLLPVLLDLFQVLVKELLPPILELFGEIVKEIFPLLIDVLKLVVGALEPLLKNLSELLKIILPPLIEIFKFLVQILINDVKNAIEGLTPVLENVMNILNNLILFVKNVFTGNWKAAWENVVEIFKNVFQGIVNAAKIPLNMLIDRLNLFLKRLRNIKIPDWVPGIGGAGFDIPNIPKLANGGKIISSGQAIIAEAHRPEMISLPEGAQVTPLSEEDKQKAIGGKKVEVIIQNMYVQDGTDFGEKASRILYDYGDRSVFDNG